MSDERKPLEMTEEQHVGWSEVADGVDCTADNTYAIVRALWPLVRDYVLEKAAQVPLAVASEPGYYDDGQAKAAAQRIRAMMGPKP